MEDCNAFIADCVVISCCCECLILQVLVFLVLELPQRVAQKTREYAKKKLRQRRKGRRSWKKGLIRARGHENTREDPVGLDVEKPTTRSSGEVEGIMNVDEWGQRQCMEEVEKVLEEFSMKGEFAFGSFWGRRENNVERGKVCMYCATCCVMHPQQELVCVGDIVKFQLIEVVGLG